MFIERIVEVVLEYFIPTFELMGIFVVACTAFKAFICYLKEYVFHLELKRNFKIEFSQGLALSLEFKMAAEILKTVVIKDMNELLVLGAVIVLRAMLSFLIHYQIKQELKEEEEEKLHQSHA